MKHNLFSIPDKTVKLLVSGIPKYSLSNLYIAFSLYLDTLLVIYQLSDIEEDFQVLIPMLLGHPVQKGQLLLHENVAK